ncbi:pH108R [Recombinant African swine fever virus]|nr:pH108R [Recombinant African swine fever virus]CAK8178890.1 pH108R [African swine fever virus]CAK8179605.1 pH108R [African swine fever virus]CAK8179854.1 pH108R [African swine fever virus]CAK8180114.1 pH108R [African swine fever virus]
MVNLFPVFTLIVIITILITTRELSTTMLIVSLVTDYIIINTQYTEQQHEMNKFSAQQGLQKNSFDESYNKDKKPNTHISYQWLAPELKEAENKYWWGNDDPYSQSVLADAS